jgi:hypothetical protein
MRSALFGVVAVVVLILAVAIYEAVHVVHQAHLSNPGMQVGIDLMSLVHVTLSPKFWVLYAGGFVVAAYLGTRGR